MWLMAATARFTIQNKGNVPAIPPATQGTPIIFRATGNSRDHQQRHKQQQQHRTTATPSRLRTATASSSTACARKARIAPDAASMTAIT
jgi:hypothetical protein